MASKNIKQQQRATEEAKRLARIEQEVEAVSVDPDLREAIAEEECEVDPSDEDVTLHRLSQTWTRVKELERGYKKARESADKRASELATEHQSLATERKAVADLSDELASEKAALVREQVDIEKERSAARAGFAEDLAEMTRKAAERRDELLEESARITEEARVRAAEVTAAARQDFDGERQRLQEQREEVRAEKEALVLRQLEIEQELNLSMASHELLTNQLKKRHEAEMSDARLEIEDLQERLTFEQENLSRHRDEIRKLQAELGRHGHDPEAAKRRIDDLQTEVAALENELSKRPSAEEAADLRKRADTATQAVADAERWRLQHDQVERQLTYQLIQVGELEVVRDQRDALEAQVETYRQALEQHKSDWEEMQSKQNAKEPFPACTAYDNDRRLNSPDHPRGVEDLEALTSELRDRMATDNATAFYYSESDVRLFLAGLASSRLHLLQGISGTGKTSLPREFFKALGGEEAAQIIEVQAGWRDKDDLFGYYNAFEKRFVESEFTKALYRALLSVNKDRPMVIVLDEMNLAHPEQYFGSMLSILENSVTEDGHLDLLTSIIPGLPKKFSGSRLPLPPNVWFVGTANHDETTVAFADKTYDRAHVQELPARHEPFRATKRESDATISFSSLQQMFGTATRNRRGELGAAKKFLQEDLHNKFAQFGIGWGNRLERQLDSFVPVVLEAGGTLTEAMDHIVATKLVRKLEDRFGVRPDDLDDLAENLEVLWAGFHDETPTRSLHRIRREADRLRGGYGA